MKFSKKNIVSFELHYTRIKISHIFLTSFTVDRIHFVRVALPLQIHFISGENTGFIYAHTHTYFKILISIFVHCYVNTKRLFIYARRHMHTYPQSSSNFLTLHVTQFFFVCMSHLFLSHLRCIPLYQIKNFQVQLKRCLSSGLVIWFKHIYICMHKRSALQSSEI